jgi:FkbM family methyltransferase
MLRLKISQFRNKMKTHGVGRALFYSADFVMRTLWNALYVRPFLKSHSQQFEDRIIDDILGKPAIGTYLDIGAYHPHNLSNTKRFYTRGWKGCNIEPNPDHFNRFVQERPDDINLNVGLSDIRGNLVFFELTPASLSTFSELRAQELRKMGAKIRSRVEVPVITMKDLFEQYLGDKRIDFCTIDTEGMDYRILKGNDWSRFRPKVLCVEVPILEPNSAGIEQVESLEVLLTGVGYKRFCQTLQFGVPLNAIYISER